MEGQWASDYSLSSLSSTKNWTWSGWCIVLFLSKFNQPIKFLALFTCLLCLSRELVKQLGVVFNWNVSLYNKIHFVWTGDSQGEGEEELEDGKDGEEKLKEVKRSWSAGVKRVTSGLGVMSRAHVSSSVCVCATQLPCVQFYMALVQLQSNWWANCHRRQRRWQQREAVSDK